MPLIAGPLAVWDSDAAARGLAIERRQRQAS
jgi:hypothetical protein